MRYLLVLCCSGLIFAQGTETKPKVEDYEVHVQAKNAAIGAEYMVHSYSRGEQMFIAKDFLVVEVAIFPPKGTTVGVQLSDFALRINGRKEPLAPASPQAVIAYMQHPEWNPERPGPHTEAGAGMGNIGVMVGGPPVNPNPYPGSQMPPPNPIPNPTYPPVDIPKENPGGVKIEHVDPSELLLQTAIVEGPRHTPISGFLFFPYRGKPTSIKSLELLYQDAVLKLR
jgi:hypothetical protein